MTALTVRHPALQAFNLPRIGAWSGSLSLHLVAVLLLLGSPVALHWVHKVPAEMTIAVIVASKPDPAVPIPPLPEPAAAPAHSHATHPVAKSLPTPVSMVAPVTSLSIPGPAVIPVPVTVPSVQVDTPPTALAYGNRTQVAYPLGALRRREQGTVILRVLVDSQGIASIVEIERSSGSAELDNAARTAVKQWHFQPATHAGRAQQAWARVPITFQLSNL